MKDRPRTIPAAQLQPAAEPLPAGDFGTWLREARLARRTRTTADVPCGTCNACCRSSYFIHIAPQEKRALARIPKALLFKAPGLPAGHVLMGYDKKGRCPMLAADKCSIYEDRPQTCRDYDCRLFTATGITAGDDAKRDINARVARWRFDVASDADQRAADALRSAGDFVQRHAQRFPKDFLPGHPTQLALLALDVCEAFAAQPEDATAQEGDWDAGVQRMVDAIVARWTELRRDAPAG